MVKNASRKIAISLAFYFAASSPLFAQFFPVPEDAVEAYIVGIKNQDFDAVLNATAVEHMSKRFDFSYSVDRIQSLSLRTSAPSTSDLFVAVNKAEFVNGVATSVRLLAYELLTESEILNGKTVRMRASDAVAFAETVDTKRLADIKLLEIGIPDPKTVGSEVYQNNAAIGAKVFGAATLAERVALISFEGATFAVGFTLIRYEEGWGVMRLGSNVAGLMLNPQPVTHEQFQMMLD